MDWPDIIESKVEVASTQNRRGPHHLISDGSTGTGGKVNKVSCLVSGFAAIRNGMFRADCGWFPLPGIGSA